MRLLLVVQAILLFLILLLACLIYFNLNKSKYIKKNNKVQIVEDDFSQKSDRDSVGETFLKNLKLKPKNPFETLVPLTAIFLTFLLFCSGFFVDYANQYNNTNPYDTYKEVLFNTTDSKNPKKLSQTRYAIDHKIKSNESYKLYKYLIDNNQRREDNFGTVKKNIFLAIVNIIICLFVYLIIIYALYLMEMPRLYIIAATIIYIIIEFLLIYFGI